MPSKKPGQRLQDILENIEAARAFIAGMDYEAFAADRKTVYAVVRALEIVSEASRRLPNEMKSRRSEVNWRAVAAAGNIYRHDYDNVNAALIWHTVLVELQPLKAAASAELEELDEA